MRYIEDFIGRLEAEKLRIAESLVNGNAVTFDAYQRLVGQHQGLTQAFVILNDLLKEDETREL